MRPLTHAASAPPIALASGAVGLHSDRRSLEGVSSAFVLKHQSWVRKQAQALVRHLPANVELSDLVQVGLLAVAQSAISFEWEGDHDSTAGTEAFLCYARMRVKGAMLDELRAGDFLSRGERQKVKRLQVARERHRAAHGTEASLGHLAEITGLAAREIGELLHADQLGRNHADVSGDADDGLAQRHHPATEADAVEAAVDQATMVRRMRALYERLTERDRAVLDAYAGGGPTPIETAAALGVTRSRVSQIYASSVRRIERANALAPVTSNSAATGWPLQRKPSLSPAWSEAMANVDLTVCCDPSVGRDCGVELFSKNA